MSAGHQQSTGQHLGSLPTALHVAQHAIQTLPLTTVNQQQATLLGFQHCWI